MDPENTADSGFDIDSAMDAIATEAPETPEVEVEQPETPPVAEATTETPAAPTVRPPPKSWAKEKHELWSKLPPDAQEYYEVREKQFLDGLDQYKGEATFAKQFKEILTPYTPMLKAAGVTETEAVQYLLNAQYRLSTGTPEQRKAVYEEIGAELGLFQPPQQSQMDPTQKALQERLDRVESSLTQRQQAELREAQAKASRQVETFASDPKHAHFDAVASDMVPYINAGFSMEDAYERAVWANPATRSLEQARLQTEAETKAKEKAKAEGEAARKATSNNVRGIESRSAPTEPKGKLFEDMGDILKEIKSRAN